MTDFVTLGSALTHAYFLMCLDKKRTEFGEDIEADAKAGSKGDPKTTSKSVSSAISPVASGKENFRPARRSGWTKTAC